MKLGYQDCGAWTLLKSTPVERRQAAWLYAQFTTCKTVSLKKALMGLTPVRLSDINSAAMTEVAPRWGGLVEFYRGPARKAWTPTGINVPDYPKLAQLWWTRIGAAVRGRGTPRQVLDDLAAAQDQVMAKLQAGGAMKRCEPRIAEPEKPETWLARPGAPKPKLDDEEGQGRTVDYDALIRSWREGNPLV